VIDCRALISDTISNLLIAQKGSNERVDNVKVDVMIEEATKQMTWRKGTLVNLLRIDGITRSLIELLGDLSEWQLRWTVSDQNERGFKHAMGYIDRIAVIQIDSNDREQTLSTYRSSRSLAKGDPVRIIGSPYGIVSPNTFMNCISTGTISNIFTSGEKIVFTDARCFPGMEGGPVLDSNGHIVGVSVVVASID
jgi:hypothetical protein